MVIFPVIVSKTDILTRIIDTLFILPKMMRKSAKYLLVLILYCNFIEKSQKEYDMITFELNYEI